MGFVTPIIDFCSQSVVVVGPPVYGLCAWYIV